MSAPTATGRTRHVAISLPTALVCAGCGAEVGADEPVRVRCPAARAGDDIDHVLRRVLDPARIAFPGGSEPNPFVRYRTLFHGYQVARARGCTDPEIVALIERLDRAVADVDGRGFLVTPLVDAPELDRRLGFAGPGGVVIKDETGNVSGSHKARHLFGTLLALELSGVECGTPLAIASCGNAALAAAVVANAAGRRLEVFVPVHAEPWVMARLDALGAEVTTCERPAGTPGDPTYRRLLAAIDAGAIPFTCQGNLNGLAVEGGLTLGYELVDQLRTTGRRLDRLVIQVGGGALAASIAQALSEAGAMGVLARMPRLHAVQTRGAHPLERAYRRVVSHLVDRLAPDTPEDPDARADRLRVLVATGAGRDELTWVARHRSLFMWPWESEPRSIAAGILDDETYDWLAVVEGMLRTGGYPIVVDEPTLAAANTLAQDATGIDVDPTGSAGLAGLLDLRRAGRVAPTETVGLLFTGIRRERPTATPPTRGERP